MSVALQQRLDHRQPEGQVGHEVRVHDVDVQPVGARARPRSPRPSRAKSADRMLGAIMGESWHDTTYCASVRAGACQPEAVEGGRDVRVPGRPGRAAGASRIRAFAGIEEPGEDQAALEQVPLGAGVAVGPAQHRAGARPGGQHDRDRARPARRRAGRSPAGTWPAPSPAITRPSNRRSSRRSRSSVPSSPMAMVIRPTRRSRHPRVGRQGEAGARGAADPRVALHDQAERAEAGRDERGRAGGVALADEPRAVHLVGHHDEAAQAARGRREGHPDRGVQVRRAVRAGCLGVAHRAGDHDGRVVGHGEVEEEGGLLDGVRAVGDHHAVRAGRELGADPVGQRHEVGEAQRRARQRAQRRRR